MQKDKDNVIEKPELFSDEKVDNGFIENYEKNMSGVHFKWIISLKIQTWTARH